MATGGDLLVRFGVLTDAQYADCDSRPAPWNASLTRHYRSALQQIRRAFRHWQAEGGVAFALQLGDVIDGVNRESGGSESALRTVMEHFQRPPIPTFHTVGNHELYNFNRRDLARHFRVSVLRRRGDALKVADSEGDEDHALSYYSFRPAPGVKCLSLDCFEVSVIGYDRDHPNYARAADLLRQHHGHSSFEGWDCADHLTGPQRRFQQMNGALGTRQLLWLEQELEDSDRRGETVVVFEGLISLTSPVEGHVCLHPESADWDCLLWNQEEVLGAFGRHRCVAAYLSGHSHRSGYARDARGVHYLVFAGIVETDPGDQAFATLDLYRDRLVVRGYGREVSRTLMLDTRPLESGAAVDECASPACEEAVAPSIRLLV